MWLFVLGVALGALPAGLYELMSFPSGRFALMGRRSVEAMRFWEVPPGAGRAPDGACTCPMYGSNGSWRARPGEPGANALTVNANRAVKLLALRAQPPDPVPILAEARG